MSCNSCRLEAVKRFPCLKVDILDKILSVNSVPHQMHCRTIKIVKIRNGHSFELARVNCSARDHTFSKVPKPASV
jgi:hypothetical protein